MTNYILEYYQKITDGSIVVGEYVLKAYQMIIKGLDDKSFFYSPKKANAAITFIETFCRHHEGELAPGLIKLELWQKAFISVVFGILDENGNRQFREVVLVIGRKNGKTLLAAAITAYCIYLDGEYGARAYFAAPKLEQANLCFSAFTQMVLNEPELSNISKKRRTDIYVPSTNSTAKPLAFSAKKSDGLNVSICIGDEFASWAGDAGLKFYEVIKSSFGARRQPLMLNISTAGYENEGVYDELMKRCTRVLKGDSKETRLLPILYMIDDVEKWNDINELQKSNPNMGVSITADYLLDEIAIAEGSLPKRAEFIVKHCNIKQNSSTAWLETNVINRCTSEELTLEDFRGSYCVGGIDLSQTTDLTACSIIIEKKGELYAFTQFFMPSERIEDSIVRDNVPYNSYISRGLLTPSGENYVDYHDCFRWFTDLVEKWEIYPLAIGYDRYSAQYLVQELDAYGFAILDDVYQGDNLYPVIRETEGIMKDGHFHFGKNDLLKLHFLDTAIKMNIERGRGRIIKLSEYVHIDGVASILDAMCVRQKYFDELGDRLINED